MDKHITILGVLYVAFSALCLLSALVVFVSIAGGGVLSGDMDSAVITTGVATALAVFLLIISLPGLIGGIGLLQYKPWARILVMVLGIINLINIPIGTILGVYTLWVLLNDETVRRFAGSGQAQAA